MEDKEFDLLVFVGRFQPLHDQHKRIIDIALNKSKNVLVLVGSAGKARTIRNPFTFDERKQMIFGSYVGAVEETLAPPSLVSDRLIIKPLYDKTYNEAAWIKQVQDIVKDTALDIANNGNSFHANGIGNMNIGLIGASKDHSSFYLKLFPQYSSVNVDIQNDIHATDIRNRFFEDELIYSNDPLPGNVINWMNDFTLSGECEKLRREYWFVHDYKKQWEAAPYPPTFVTTDALVICSGHVLLIERKAEPGKGLLALPGGFLNQDEKIIDGTIRELREETKIKVPDPVLRGSIDRTDVFDDPHRSTRGRTITHCSLIKLANSIELPKVKGSDDARTAGWYKLGELDETMLFEDHWAIIEHQLGI